MQKTLSIMLLVTLAYGAETVLFDNNWAEHPLFNVVSQTPTGVEILFSMHRLVIEETLINGMPMKTYGVPGMFLPNDEGAPNLTGTGRYIALPQGARAEVTILDARTTAYHDVDVAPAPNIPRETDHSPLRYEKDMTIYNRNAFYPESVVRVSKPMKIRGVDVVILGITPFQYNPVTKELIVYKDLRVRVDFVGGNGHFGEDRLRSRFWEPILQGHLLNYNSLPEIDFYAPERTSGRYGYEYIIIVPDDAVFEAWADTIKAWRKLQGISCEVFTLTEVGGSSASEIKNFLHNAYNTWDPAPVAFLLLSDYPISGDDYGITSPVWTGTGGSCVSENIYADATLDELPDMHHGRICAQGEVHLSTMINKFLSYERNPYTAANFYDEPLVACGWQTDRWFQVCIEVIRGFFINALGKNPAREYGICDGTPYPGCEWSTNTNTPTIVAYFGSAGLGYIPDTNPYDWTWWTNGSADGINAAINSGAFLIQHRDHGLEEGWGDPPYENSDLDNLTNTMFTFVYSTNCLTGKFDWFRECFCEKFHRIDYGALGANGATETSYSFVNDTYVWGMYDCLWPQFMPEYPSYNPIPVIGEENLMPCIAMTSGKYFLESSDWPYNSDYKSITYYLFHHHGDCFNILYSQIPQNLTVSHPPFLTAGDTLFAVTADNGSAIALTVNGEILGVAEGTDAPRSITIPAQSAGDTMKVTVTRPNYYRYEVDVPIVASSYAYVTRSSDIIDDETGGNNDGLVNPGETIDYGVWAKNVGSAIAQGVYGTLTLSDPFVTLLSDSSWYGDIVQYDSALSEPYYSFSVDSNCPDGHEIDFTFYFHDVYDSIFTSYRTLIVYAPALTCQDVSVVNDNNLNAILEPTETADLIVTIKNEGSTSAENVTSVLRTTSSYVTINDSIALFGSIDPDTSVNNASDPYNVTAISSTPYGTEINFSMIVQAGVYNDTFEFTLTVGQLVPSDTGYYYAYFSGSPHSESPVFNWIAIDSTQTTYPGVSLDLGDDEVFHVNLPFTFTYYGVDYDTITISSNGWIAMGVVDESYPDHFGIPDPEGPEAMIAGIWDNLDPGNAVVSPSDIYYYDDAPNHRFIVEYFEVEHWPYYYFETFEIILYDPVYYPTSTGDGEIVVQYLVPMQREDITIGIENASESVGIQYFYDYCYHTYAGPITDSFALKYTTDPPSNTGIQEHEEVSAVPLDTRLSACYPNPFNREHKISYQLSRLSNVDLKIYDVAGRLVRVVAHGLHHPGYYTTIWDAKDDAGRTVSSGIYFVRLVVDDYKGVEKSILIK